MTNKNEIVRVTECRFNECGFTVGSKYKLHKDYSNDMFVDGEEYVIDDEGRSNYGISMICKIEKVYMN
ncbi:hypothetical protein [Paenibacillus odorifer]|uniref:hypothetical protein n=1 Tax=Paenibacillus odorifer TaxID=189426 RepID=UPI00096E3E04|nr:hypothetical protein [Paenibacillus odorifer]OMD78253.1 hypothetical protein BSK50_10925 [Paenibacillus odorifer]